MRYRVGRVGARVAFAFLAAVGLAGCASQPGPSVADSSAPTSSRTASPTSSLTTSVSTSGGSTTSASASVEVAAAVRAALSLYERSPNDLNDPSAGYVWSARPWASSPLSPALRERLSWLQAHDYFSDRFCGESYLNGNQVGLSAAPTVESSDVNSDGTVTVVLRRALGDTVRPLTAVLSAADGVWLATDLQVGTGAHASIFADTPTC